MPSRAASLPRRVRLNDLHVVHRAVLGVCFHHSYSIHHSYTLADAAKNGVFAIKPLGRGKRHEKLAAVGVWPCIGHGEDSSPWWVKKESKNNPQSSSWAYVPPSQTLFWPPPLTTGPEHSSPEGRPCRYTTACHRPTPTTAPS